jgi:hypothetical protein
MLAALRTVHRARAVAAVVFTPAPPTAIPAS